MTREDQALSLCTIATDGARDLAVIRGHVSGIWVVRLGAIETARAELRSEPPFGDDDRATKALSDLCQRAALRRDCATNLGAVSGEWKTILQSAVDAKLVTRDEAARILAGP